MGNSKVFRHMPETNVVGIKAGAGWLGCAVDNDFLFLFSTFYKDDAIILVIIILVAPSII
jgi:hypothetical protein